MEALKPEVSQDWHTQTKNAMRYKSASELLFIMKNCHEDIRYSPVDDPRIQQYRDELSYAHTELRSRGLA